MTPEIGQIPTVFTWIRKNLFTTIMITVGGLIGFGTYEFLDGWARPFGNRVATQHEDLRRAVASYTALDDILNRDMTKFHASRAILYRLHDDEVDVSHMAFFFASAANVVAVPGVTVDIIDLANIPAATFAPVLPGLIRAQPQIVTTDALPPGPLRELKIKRGVKIAAFIPVSDLDGNLIAFFVLEWLNPADMPTGDEQKNMQIALHDDAARISGYFSLAPLHDPPPRR